MTELTTGLLFAAWFAMAYLLVSKSLRLGQRGRAVLRGLFNSRALSAQGSTAAQRPRLFMTTEELSAHHRGEKAAPSSKAASSSADRR
ncbi:MAG TPA: hypothetical protein VF723_06940 [Pyrinomonadaceae bacterium]|jgi:hypothetical protein